MNKLPFLPANLPNISRSFPESFFTTRVFLFNFMVGFLLMAIIIVGKDIELNTQRLQVTRLQRSVAETQLAKWQKIVKQFPGYRDGYYQLALLEEQVGDKQSAYQAAQQTLQIDPGFEPGKALITKLTN